MSLSFSKASSSQEIQNILDYNINAFVDTPGFTWDLSGIKREIDDGWDLYGVQFEKEIIAAVFLRVDGENLFTKNIGFQKI